MKTKISGISTLFILFFLLLYIQHHFVFMYYDDYGYASLSYGYTGNTVGMDYSLADVFHYIKWHYLEWGGRILYYFLGILSMRTGLWCIRVVQCFFILGIVIFSGQLIEKENDFRGNFCKVFLLIFLYAAIGRESFRDGIFWFSAAMGYVWPLCSLFAAIDCQKKYYERGKGSYLILSGVLFFTAAFSYEQVALMTAVYTILYYTFRRLREGRKCGKDGIFLISASVIGCGVEILAPGNFVRAGDKANEAFFALPIQEKLAINIPKILEINLGQDNWIPVLVFLASGLMCAWILYRGYSGKAICKWNLPASLILSVLMVAAWRMDTQWYRYGIMLLWAAWYIVNVTATLWKGMNWMTALFYAGLCSQGMLMMSPTIPVRCNIPFSFVMHIVAAYLIVEFFTQFCVNWGYGFLGMLAILSLFNASSITIGYYRNAEINEINRSKLIEKSYRVKAGMEVPAIVLYRMRDDLYAGRMPYQETYIDYWVKAYYELPQSVNLIWNTIEDYSEVNEIAVSDRPKIVKIYPGEEDKSIHYNEDGSLDIGVTPEIFKDSLRLWINNEAAETIIGDGFVSARVSEGQLTTGELKIYIVDEETGETSDAVIMNVNR